MILDDGWLAKLARHARDGAPDLIAATGSWISHLTQTLDNPDAVRNLPLPAGRKVPLPRVLARIARRGLISYLARRFDAFPNYHVRTNCFLVRRELLLASVPRRVYTKLDAYAFESARSGLSGRCKAAGGRLLVVGRDGNAYAEQEWAASNTFWQGDQENLLVADNQTMLYQAEDLSTRAALSRVAAASTGRGPRLVAPRDARERRARREILRLIKHRLVVRDEQILLIPLPERVARRPLLLGVGVPVAPHDEEAATSGLAPAAQAGAGALERVCVQLGVHAARHAREQELPAHEEAVRPDVVVRERVEAARQVRDEPAARDPREDARERDLPPGGQGEVPHGVRIVERLGEVADPRAGRGNQVGRAVAGVARELREPPVVEDHAVGVQEAVPVEARLPRRERVRPDVVAGVRDQHAVMRNALEEAIVRAERASAVEPLEHEEEAVRRARAVPAVRREEPLEGLQAVAGADEMCDADRIHAGPRAPQPRWCLPSRYLRSASRQSGSTIPSARAFAFPRAEYSGRRMSPVRPPRSTGTTSTGRRSSS